MKKRNQKLSLNRETVARLQSLPAAVIDRIAGGLVREAAGDMTSCGEECGCPASDTYAY
ncbi:MAG TPA: class I lanthipeptide [Thermoanaerobaculia bacterium]|nr:class I lanthipeptide [Thermoanaerobaculia bacterium]